jgi:hypothetical protein
MQCGIAVAHGQMGMEYLVGAVNGSGFLRFKAIVQKRHLTVEDERSSAIAEFNFPESIRIGDGQLRRLGCYQPGQGLICTRPVYGGPEAGTLARMRAIAVNEQSRLLIDR